MDAEDYLLKIPLWTKKKNTLSDVRRFLGELGNPDHDMKIIHVAGTNGKGSVCACLTAELMQLGYQVGTFISPHLISVRERLLFNGQPIDPILFQETLERLIPLVEDMMTRGYQHPSFFEYLFLMAMVYYREHPVDYLILETGLGGLLDTTNVIDRPVLTVITSISLEHTQFLGNTIREIAMHKAGILKRGCPLVYDDNQPEASAVIRAQAALAGVRCYPVAMPGRAVREGFAAPYQAMNAMLACQALEVLNLPGWKKKTALSRLQLVVWPGRMEEVAPDIWLDGAHNEGGIRAFAEAAARIRAQRDKRLHLLFAAVADKNYRQMIALICDKLPLQAVTVAHFDAERAADQDTLASEFTLRLPDVSVVSFADTRAALNHAMAQKTEDDLLFVVGSLYLIGEIKAIMEEQHDKF